MSIASELQTLIANKIAIKNAILAKSPATPPGDNLANWPTSIESISEAESDNPVKFRDCDGTILHSYTVAEVASMSNLPPLPTRDGLTCQGWNWTLQQIKDYVASYGKCEIGATYTTDDSKTRIKLTIQDKKYTKIPIVFQQTVANGVKVNWGDGSADETYSSTSQQTIDHTYTPSAYPATYTITFEVTSGTMFFPYNIMGKGGSESASTPIGAWNNMIDEVNIGNGVTSIWDNVFQNCYSLASISIPSSVTSIEDNVFQNCYSFASISIPSSVTSIGNNAFQNCYSLTSITIPNSVTSIGTNAFNKCYSLTSITIPNSVTSIGSSMLQECYSLASVIIPNSVTSIGSYAFYTCTFLTSITIPNSVTSIGDAAFSQCYSLASISIPSSVTKIGNNAFGKCYSLTSITIPNSVTNIGTYAFQYCYSLASITIPNSVTSIGTCLFYYCYSLASVTIPSSVTSIGTYAFQYCYGLKTFDFRRSTAVPTLSDVNAFQNTTTDKEIVVPDELYDAWIAATNWSLSTNQIKESIVKASESSIGTLN